MPFANKSIEGSRIWSVDGNDPSCFGSTINTLSPFPRRASNTSDLSDVSVISLGSQSTNFLNGTKRSSFAVPLGDQRFFFQVKLDSDEQLWQMYVSESMWQQF